METFILKYVEIKYITCKFQALGRVLCEHYILQSVQQPHGGKHVPRGRVHRLYVGTLAWEPRGWDAGARTVPSHAAPLGAASAGRAGSAPAGGGSVFTASILPHSPLLGVAQNSANATILIVISSVSLLFCKIPSSSAWFLSRRWCP